jgi:hypothetical protein
MNTITAQLAEEQFLDGNRYRVNAELFTDVASENAHSVTWSFRCVDEHSVPLLHSGNTNENVNLQYANEDFPLLEITAPDDSPYNILVIARLSISLGKKDLTIYSLDAQGNLITTIEEKYVDDIQIIESPVFTIGGTNV